MKILELCHQTNKLSLSQIIYHPNYPTEYFMRSILFKNKIYRVLKVLLKIQDLWP